MIHEVDQTLVSLVFEEFQRLPGSKIDSRDQIVFASGTQLPVGTVARPVISFCLHDVRENTKLRDESFVLNRPEEADYVFKKRASVKLDVSYLVTVHAGEDAAVEHRLLGELLGIFFRNVIIPDKYRTEMLRSEGPTGAMISVIQPDHESQKDQPSIWRALQGPLRPGLGLVVTASFNPFETQAVRTVREVLMGIGQAAPPDAAPRPIDVSSIRVSVAGVVRDSSGSAISGVKVTISGRPEETLSQDNGLFWIANLPPGPYVVGFSKSGYVSDQAETVAPAPGRADTLRALNVILKPDPKGDVPSVPFRLVASEYVTINGILRYDDDTPCRYVLVRAGEKETVTDGEGRYALSGFTVKPRILTAVIPGVGEIKVNLEIADSQRVPKGEAASKSDLDNKRKGSKNNSS